MTTLSIQPPFPILTDTDGSPLENGYIWIGTANLPAQTNPIAVYWDAALTIPAALPIRTRGGYPVNAGTPARLYVGSDYSILVQNKNGSTLYSAPAATERYSDPVVTGISSAEVSFLQAGSGAVTRTAQSKMRDVVSVKDFGAVGDGVADDTVAIQAALNSLSQYQTLWFHSGSYIISAQLTVPTDFITITGNAKIKAKNGAQFEFMLLATSKQGVSVEGLEFDANKSGRSTGQTVRFMGAAFISCVDCSFINCVALNCLGYNNIPGVGLAAAGNSTRCKIDGCRLLNCGGTSGTDAADGVFTSGYLNVISNSQATNCTDTGFVIESSTGSVISGCTAYECAASAAITNASANPAYNNVINGLSGFNWDASNTGGIQIGVPTATSGNLVNTIVSNVTMYAETSLGYGDGAAINVRNVGSGKATGVTISNVRINGSKNQGILINGESVSVSGCTVQGTTDACIQVQSGTDHHFTSNYLKGGSFGIVTQSTSSVAAQSNVCTSQTSTGITALNTSTIDSLMNIVRSPSVSRYSKDVGATLNIVGAEANQLMINNAVGAATSGSIVNKFVVTDSSGSPLGYVPVYNI